jgi:hypothetical protein
VAKTLSNHHFSPAGITTGVLLTPGSLAVSVLSSWGHVNRDLDVAYPTVDRHRKSTPGGLSRSLPFALSGSTTVLRLKGSAWLWRRHNLGIGKQASRLPGVPTARLPTEAAKVAQKWFTSFTRFTESNTDRRSSAEE